MSKSVPNVRYSEVDRETRHTRVHLVIDFEGGSRRDVSTGIATLDEMLIDAARYAGIDLGVSVESDVAISDHHIVEDVGSALGRAIRLALEDIDSTRGVGHSMIPSGDSLVLCAVDVKGRSYLGWDLSFHRDWIGALATENIEQFFRHLVDQAGLSLHIRKIAGTNDAHLCEAIFRSFGTSLRQAAAR